MQISTQQNYLFADVKTLSDQNNTSQKSKHSTFHL